MAVTIRAMAASDWPAVAAIYEQGIVDHKATFAQQAPSYADWDAEHHRHTRLVAETEGGQVVGWVVLAPSFAREVYSGVAEISIYIHDAYKRRGIGRMLLEAAARESEDNGIWTIEALIFADNLPSLALFRSCGYTELGVRKKLGYDPALGCWRDVAMLERRSSRKDFA